MPSRPQQTLVLLVLALVGCSSDPVERLIAQLDQSERREQAIAELLAAVRRAPPARRAQVKERVIGALGEAYREDLRRPQIVAALAMLRDRRAEHVFLAAIGDAERGGEHFEAAVRAARMLATLGCRAAVPKLVQMLRRAHRRPAIDRQGYLRRATIEALELLGDRRAVPALVEVLRAGPTEQAVELNRRAARALGTLRAKAAAGPLVRLLGGTAHRLLVYQPSRRALCAIGPAVLPALWARVDRGARGDRQLAVAARRVVGDLAPGPRKASGEIPAADPPALRLAAAEAWLRAGPSPAAEKVLLAAVADAQLPARRRRRAADLLGWYGGSGAAAGLLELDPPQAGTPLHWAVARAYARTGREAGEALTRLVFGRPQAEPGSALADRAAKHHLATYRPRLALVARCGARPSCYLDELGNSVATSRATTSRPAGAAGERGARDWRAGERAALELGRLLADPANEDQASVAAGRVAGVLAAQLADSHPDLTLAALISLERLASARKLDAGLALRLARKIDSALESSESDRIGEPLVSRAFCLARRLERISRR